MCCFDTLLYNVVGRTPHQGVRPTLLAIYAKSMLRYDLELSVARRTREGNDVTDVRHTCDEEQETLKAQSEA